MGESPRPRHRNTRVLTVLFAVAASALVVSAVTLAMVNSPADFPTTRPVTKVTETESRPAMSPPPPAPTTASSTVPTTTEMPTAEPTTPLTTSVPHSSHTTATTRPHNTVATSEQPRSSVTRNPMSFHPSPIPKP